MEIVRIPSSYLTQMEYLPDKDLAYVTKTVFKLCNGEDIKVEKSMRGGLVVSIYREATQMENKARAKKGKKRLEVDTATLMAHTESEVEDKKVQPSNITSSQDKEHQEKESKEIILSKDNKAELIKKQITLDIDSLILEIKKVCDKNGLAYDKTKDRMFGKHIVSAKEYGEFCDKLGLTRIQFAINIVQASNAIKYWKGICTGPMAIYQNYSDVYNKAKLLQEKNTPINKNIGTL